jgi:hypothetical protein
MLLTGFEPGIIAFTMLSFECNCNHAKDNTMHIDTHIAEFKISTATSLYSYSLKSMDSLGEEHCGLLNTPSTAEGFTALKQESLNCIQAYRHTVMDLLKALPSNGSINT